MDFQPQGKPPLLVRPRFVQSSLLAFALVVTVGGCSSGGGGASGSGGSNSGSGGSSASGGNNGSGSGGSQGSGGRASSGGATGSGGASNGSGGNNASGGSSSGGSSSGGASSGGAVGSGGTSSSGGTVGSGGTASGGAVGSGGTTGAGGGQGGSTATGSGGPSGGGGVADCATLPLCDSFESGSTLNATLWTTIPSSPGGTATIDSMGAHGSAHSLKVASTDRLYLRNSTVIGTLGDVVHVRYYARFGTALAAGHGALIVTHPMAVDQYSQSNELRFGSQDNVFHWNTDSDAANIPDVSPNGDAASFKPVANQWYCIELIINTNGHLNVSIDGTDIPGLTMDGVATANVDQSWISSGSTSLSRYAKFADFNFGWQSYGGGALTVWYDDVALSASPIGCY
ncbi:MAG TPA: hypothetical protein VGP07_02260 [Polyangia bacterium]|jgi:hypothetical protein